MNVFTKVAIRSITRNSNRNILIGISVALAVGLFFLVLSIASGIEKQLVGILVEIETGAVSFSPHKEMLKGETLLDKEKLDHIYSVIQSDPKVSNIRERVHSRALISANDKSGYINIRGVDWTEEPHLFSTLTFEEGLEENDRSGGLLISQNVADKLHLKQGEYCTVLIQTIHGALNLEEYPIHGVYKNISGWANTLVFLDIKDSRSLVNTTLPTNVLIDCVNLKDASEVKSKVSDILSSSIDDTIEVGSYDERSMMASTISNANKYGFLSIIFFLQLISFFGIGFVVNNNIMERKKEIGTLLAIGYAPNWIRLSFIIETFLIAVLSSLVGLIFFGSIALFYSYNGISIGDTVSIIFGSTVLKPYVSMVFFLMAFCVGIIYPLVSVVWSTRKIRKMNPVEVLYDR